MHAITSALQFNQKLALGFECPLSVPLPQDPRRLTSARLGEGRRPWSAGAGAGVLAIGLSEVVWILREIRKKNSSFLVYLEWPEFARAAEGIFLWEALVSGAAKKDSYHDDARAAVEAFISAAMAGPPASCISCDEPYNLIGAALLRTGWVNHPDYLSRPCLVIKA